MYDVPWEVGWNTEFEADLHGYDSSGDLYENLCGTVEKIIQDPIRVGKYKEGSLKNIRTTHVEQHIIGWEVNPGVNQASLQDKVEEVYFHFLAHHDGMSTGVTNKNPVDKSTDFEVHIPYFGTVDIPPKLNEIYVLLDEIEDGEVDTEDWLDEYVLVTGTIPPDSRDALEAILPDSADTTYDDPELV